MQNNNKKDTMEKQKILIFPLIKKLESPPKKSSNDYPTDEQVDELIYHYLYQIINHLKNHNIPINERFVSDFNLTHESLKAAVMRACGKFHPLHDLIDVLEIDGNKKTPTPKKKKRLIKEDKKKED